MHEIDADHLADYLRETGRIGRDEAVEIRELAGGVSNVVFYVDGRNPFVVKQARERLRVTDLWLCSVERIWREVAVLRTCETILAGTRGDASGANTAASITTPQVLFEDRKNFLFGMSAAPPSHTVWKRLLLQGQLDGTIAQQCGWLLGTLHAATWHDAELARDLGDCRFFDDLRIDPYYRKIAAVHQDLRTPIEELIQSLADHRSALVHGDFSPKNLLVYDGGLMLVDFEVGHFGDPAFDLGFFLTHLVLKSIWSGAVWQKYWQLTDRFWSEYTLVLRSRISEQAFAELFQRAIANLAGCLLARVDGKSPVEYLESDSLKNRVRRVGRDLLLRPPPDWSGVRLCVERSDF